MDVMEDLELEELLDGAPACEIDHAEWCLGDGYGFPPVCLEVATHIWKTCHRTTLVCELVAAWCVDTHRFLQAKGIAYCDICGVDCVAILEL